MLFRSEASAGLGGDTNRATLVEASAATPLPEMGKLALADQILDRVRTLLHSPPKRPRRETGHKAPN